MPIHYSKGHTINLQTGEKVIYAVAQYTGIMELDEFAKHISEHNSVFDRATVQGVLTKATECLREMLLNGYKVRWGTVGDFYVTLHSDTTNTATSFSASNIKSVEVRLKVGKELQNLRAEATFEEVQTRKMQAYGRNLRDAQIDGTIGNNTGSEGQGSGDDDGSGGGSLG